MLEKESGIWMWRAQLLLIAYGDVQAATAAVPPGAGCEPPRGGDGFTFEHLADRKTLWLDFTADTGDGG